MNNTSPSVLLLAAFGAAVAAPGCLTAQGSVAVPAYAGDVDGHESLSLPFGVPGFRTQLLIDAAAIAPTQGILTGIRLRADRPSAPQSAVSVPNITVSLSHCNLVLGNLGNSFAGNVTSTATQVFSGTVNLPAQTPGLAGPAPWDIAITFAQPYVFSPGQGNLLVDIVGNNPPGGNPRFYLDAKRPGGSATTFGTAGDNPSFDFLNLIVSTNGILEPRLLTPGHTVEFSSTLSFTTPPGVLALGFDAFATPFDLGQLGAPTHSVYLPPLAMVSHSWTSSFIGWYSTVQVAIPNSQAFAGLRLYAQSILFDASANALGMLTSAAVEVRIGESGAALPMQQLDANDPTAPFGTVVDFGFGSPEFGAVPILLEGTFF